MAAALNRRIHHDTINANAPTVAAEHGGRIAVDDVIIRPQRPTITVLDVDHDEPAPNPVRNGNR